MARIELKYCTIRMRDGLSGAGDRGQYNCPRDGRRRPDARHRGIKQPASRD